MVVKSSIKIIFCLLLLPAANCFSQIQQENLAGYEREWLHFGFTLAMNKADFILVPQAPNKGPDTVLGVTSHPDLGFNLGIVSDLRIHEYVTLRFVPDLSFQDRTVEYNIYSPTKDTTFTITKKVESTLLDFPINLKIRSERWHNMSPYLLAGGKFSIDLASQKNTNNPDLLKLTPHDWSYEVGFGIDFYLVYFKLSAEIKLAAGIKDRLIHENTLYSSAIEHLYTKVWLFSLNFEG